MKVLHIAYHHGMNNSGGAAIASTRLHAALLKRGVESRYVCVNAREPGENVVVLPRGWRRLIRDFLSWIGRGVWKVSSYRQSVWMNLVPMFGLEDEIHRFAPDVIHLHFLRTDVISIRQLARLGEVGGCKVVVNLHDLYMINALAPQPEGDGRYIDGFAKGNSKRLERWMFCRKRRAMARLRPEVIAPSRWACACCAASLIGRGLRTWAIPNLTGDAFWCEPREKNGRFVILFGANGGRSQPAKGFDNLRAALRALSDEVKAHSELRIFGERGEDCQTEGVQTRFLGSGKSAEEMRRIYKQADVYAFPSRCETQGMTKVEAMLCGVPVIAFDRTACAEGIDNGRMGIVVRDGDVSGYADGIRRYYERWFAGELENERSTVADLARRKFNADRIVDAILAAYEGFDFKFASTGSASGLRRNEMCYNSMT